ncbi:MAG: type II secretion system protein GspJ [Pseudomonadota bacterium]|nr:type II secretion system protein GspJ [Pseudomonadota bacterium]
MRAASSIGAPNGRRAGFTLLEVIVALTVFAIIAGLTFGTIASALNTRDLLEEDDAVNQSARIAMSRIRRDLSLAYLTINTGAVNTYKTLFVAHDQNPDRLWFASLAHQRLYRGARESDQTEITYWTEDDPDTSGALVLLRREAPRIDNYPERDGTIAPLAYDVKAFEVRFLDSLTNEWKEEWDTTGAETPNRLPRAAQVTLTLLAPDPDDAEDTVERTWASTVMLEFAPRLTPKSGAEEDAG